MNSILKKTLQSLLFVPILALGVSTVGTVLNPASQAVHAAETNITDGGVDEGANAARGKGQPSGLFSGDSVFKKIVNVLLFVIGAIAVIMLIYGGFRYVLSGGDASAVTSAKNTILYAVVGIIVALLAFALVNFVTGQFTDVNGG